MTADKHCRGVSLILTQIDILDRLTSSCSCGNAKALAVTFAAYETDRRRLQMNAIHLSTSAISSNHPLLSPPTSHHPMRCSHNTTLTQSITTRNLLPPPSLLAALHLDHFLVAQVSLGQPPHGLGLQLISCEGMLILLLALVALVILRCGGHCDLHCRSALRR